MLVLIPNSKITHFFTNSIFIPLVLLASYSYVAYQAILLDQPLLDIFKLYLSLDDLYTIFATESLLVIFWLHFLTLSIFLGTWISKDSIKYNLPHSLVMVTLVLVYFTGPLGLVLYWFIRIFSAKKLGFHD